MNDELRMFLVFLDYLPDKEKMFVPDRSSNSLLIKVVREMFKVFYAYLSKQIRIVENYTLRSKDNCK